MGLGNFLFGRMLDRRISEYQNDLITKHYDEVQNIYKQMRGWRHDYHNHIQTMKAHLALGQTDELDEYLSNLDTDLSAVDTVIQTGNVMIDAILNSKLSLIATKNISVNTKATVPSKLRISEIDLCIIIGNLLDNAMEACLKQTTRSDRFIRVYIGILKEQLYISVSNSVGGEVIKSGKTFLSTKDSATHGFGLMRVDRITDKYNGYVNRQNEEGVFATEVMLPL
ncbi:ATPase [Paenibacillus baekrokdamisoli]|uniref:ATPase n=2 Tax=Paenibacillus baekrokdamisoli TaxID=1712516 RepID=A0A3G9IY42_9BACL|nr:GHKL domain-containing protein [Paenibacillus baekrokdamisoli]BBH23252.1 ATPase [Paenibacillus baekrokdamisoli]